MSSENDRDQLNIKGVLVSVIQEFDALRIGKARGEKDIPRWQMFEDIFNEWKAFKAAGFSVPDLTGLSPQKRRELQGIVLQTLARFGGTDEDPPRKDISNG